MVRRVFFLLLLTLATPLSFSEEVITTKFPTLRDAYLDKVFVSDDGEWPIGSQYLIQVNKPKDSLESIEDLLYDLDRVLPAWYKQIIFHSQGDNECQAIVNDVDYTILVETFTWEKIILEQKEFYAYIQSEGLDSKLLIDNAITYSFCTYIKTNDMNNAEKVFYSYRKKYE